MIRPAVLLALPALLCAHSSPEHNGLVSGLAHPIHGLDHLLAMVAIGCAGARLGWPRALAPALVFMLAMVLGYGLGLGGLTVPGLETAIVVSVIGLGLAAALATPMWALLPLAVVAGLPHGWAHGLEAGPASGVTFGLGMLISSLLLHAAGLVIGASLAQPLAGRFAWAPGAVIAAAGCLLIVL